jgi:NOL1/NOP2/fmu family ribosome biogenesis protein
MSDDGDGDVDPGDGSDADPNDAGEADSVDASDASDPSDNELRTNVGQQFGRLPATDADREVAGRASRAAVVGFFEERFGIDPAVFESVSFWEKGKGKIWVFADDAPSPIEIEGLGMTVLRTRQEHWKPTQSAVQRFGRHASKNVVEVDGETAATFARGEDQPLAAWEGDWGYLIVAHEIGGEREPIGVGLYLYDELRSTVPKGNRETLPPR